jgi:hypothetical protein
MEQTARALTTVAALAGAGTGALAALATLHGRGSPALGALFAAAAIALAALAYVAHLVLSRPDDGEADASPVIAFLLAAAFGLMVAGGTHGAHG